jgi:hypothetical protein
MDNLEPLEPLTGLVPEQGLEYATAWDSDDREVVSWWFENSKTSFSQ